MTVEDMADMLLEDSRNTLRGRLWEDFDEADTKLLFTLVWELNTSSVEETHDTKPEIICSSV